MIDGEATLSEVGKALAAEPRLADAKDHLSVAIEDNGALTIAGDVDTVAEKRIALERVAAVKGLAGVIDRLHVRPAEEMPDHAIRGHILLTLYEDTAFRNIDLNERQGDDAVSYSRAPDGALGEITVEAKEGVVILNGAVPSLEHKRLAGLLAWWAPGGRDVVNGIAVEPEEEDSPDHIEEAVRIALEKDPFVNAAQIRAGVRGRVVRLTGAVTSETERHMAESDAWYVFGVDDVINHIEIVPG